MNRREFVKCIGAVAGAAAMHGIAFANEGDKKMKVIVVNGTSPNAEDIIAQVEKTGCKNLE